MHYPLAVLDPNTGALISDALAAETGYTLSIRGHGRVTARLVVRRVKDARYPDALFPVWRYHPFSPTPSCPPPRPTSPTAGTPSRTTFADLRGRWRNPVRAVLRQLCLAGLL